MFDEDPFLAVNSFSANVYPNPFNHSLNLEFVSPTTGKADVKVYNSLGQLVLSQEIQVAENEQIVSLLNLSSNSIESGLYSVRVKVGDQYFTNARAIKH